MNLLDDSVVDTLGLVSCLAAPLIQQASRAAIKACWDAGYADTCRMIERRPWDNPIDPSMDVAVYASDSPAQLSRHC